MSTRAGRVALVTGAAVAEAVVWLAPDRARGVTGQALAVDAGHTVLPGYDPAPVRST